MARLYINENFEIHILIQQPHVLQQWKQKAHK
ncbi:hypothetical protein NIES4073_25920 [Kalymmatonema gypsitolerans NIES-4073]|nr:hypothetical protein NIES4073_25920 [Scytonema sp. NIES-4073]